MAKPQWERGLIALPQLAIYESLLRAPSYGYGLAKELNEAGFDWIDEAFVYGVMDAMRRGGRATAELAASPQGPRRKYYTATPAAAAERERGRAILGRALDALRSFD